MKKRDSNWKACIRPDGSFDFDALTPAQKEQYYAECETVKASDTRPLTARDRKLLQKAARLGRPRVGLGSQRAQITVEKGLLKAADQFAVKHRITRSRLITEALKQYMEHAA